jgi:CheY-like chemotaxis protein
MPTKGRKKKPPAKRPPILVVDDTGMVRQTLIRILKLGKFDTLEAAGAEEAVRIVAQRDVSLILLDINMPGVDGISLCAKLKQTEKIKNVPIIMCTAMHEQSFIVRARAAGACDYIVKPFEPPLVLQKVLRALGIPAAPTAKPAAPAPEEE